VELVAAGDSLGDAGMLRRTVLNLTLAAFLISLAAVRHRGYHTVVVLVLLVMLTVQWSRLRLV
jgi:hypothetical protein